LEQEKHVLKPKLIVNPLNSKIKKGIYSLIISFALWPILDLFISSNIGNFPILRYCVYGLCSYYIFTLYNELNKNNHIRNKSFKFIIKFILFVVSIQFLVNFSEVFDSRQNFINLKYCLSGGVLLYFSIFFLNIQLPLPAFKILLKASFYLTIIFLVFSLMFFSYFRTDTANSAELFVKTFMLGGMYLFLLFPYQKRSTNLIVFFSFE
jgi:hypothetical protein